MYSGGHTWYDTRNIRTTTVPDRGVGGFTATLSATVPPVAGPYPGMVGLSFAATPSMTCPIGYTSGDFSLSYWVYFFDKPNTGGTSTYQYVLGGGRLQIHQYVNNTEYYYDNGGTVSFPQTGATWTHLTFVYTTSGTTNITVYKNGVQVASANKPITAANTFRFGEFASTFTGYIADIRIVPFKLTATQASLLYQSYEAGTWFIPLISIAPALTMRLTNVVVPTIRQTFSGTGTVQTFTVPAGVNAIRFFMWAAGGTTQNGTPDPNVNNLVNAGSGAYVEGNLVTTPGTVYSLIVGRAGIAGLANGAPGTGGLTGGGGFSGIFSGTPAAGTVIAIAGGGGGSGYNSGGNGGGGGYPSGLNGTNSGGQGGTQVAGGAASASGGTAGSQLQGGNGVAGDNGGGGGGGGWYGGGGANGQRSGGGGSSTYTSIVINPVTVNGNTGVFNGTVPTAAANESSPYWVSPAGRTGRNGLIVIGYSQLQPTLQLVPFLPPRIPGLQLWLDGADLSTFTLSGASVTQWRDKSGFGRNAVGNLGSGTYSATGLNSRPTVQIAVSGNMRAPVPAGTFSAGVALFLVYQKTGANQSFDTLVTRTVTNQAAPFDLYTTNSNTTRLISNGGPSAAATEATTNLARRTTPTILFQGIPAVPAGSTLVWNETINGGTLTVYTLGTGSTYGDTATDIYLGTRADNFTKMIGNISEVIMYALDSLTTLQRQQVEGYLAWKWGLQGNLPANHPYANRPPP